MSLYRLKGTSGPVINQAWSLGDRSVIGTAPECDIQIEGESIAPRHAALELAEDELRLRLLDGALELFVNGEAVKSTLLASGDEIRIGSCRWLLQAPGLRPEKVLTEKAVRRQIRLLPWLIAGGLSALALLAWRLGLLPF